MRGRLNLLVLAVTSLVVVAFLVPLGLLVRRQADQRARLEAERSVQTLAAVVVRSAAAQGGLVSADALAADLGPLPPRATVVLPSGERFGSDPLLPELVDQAVADQSARSAYTEAGWSLAVPVITRSGPVVVAAFVPAEDLSRGVTEAWALLAALGVGLIFASLLAADRLGRTVVAPSRRLAEAALRLGGGDLSTRVEVEGPPELEAIAAAFNTLAGRLRDLLAAEREMVADLSHRLRTPLTALQLQAEQISDPDQQRLVLAQVDRVRRAVDELIAEARRHPEELPAACEVVSVVADRARFWQVLAEEQGREMVLTLPSEGGLVAAAEGEVAAALDALIGNVFSHTQPRVGLRLSVEMGPREARIEVADRGPGFPPGFDPSRRGASGRGSTGLGMDIARRLAEGSGGSLTTGAAPEGGALVVMTLLRARPGD